MWQEKQERQCSRPLVKKAKMLCGKLVNSPTIMFPKLQYSVMCKRKFSSFSLSFVFCIIISTYLPFLYVNKRTISLSDAYSLLSVVKALVHYINHSSHSPWHRDRSQKVDSPPTTGTLLTSFDWTVQFKQHSVEDQNQQLFSLTPVFFECLAFVSRKPWAHFSDLQNWGSGT